jgi:Flp pilus assembly protein CpaB
MKMTQRRMARPSLGGILATRQGALLLAVLCAAAAAGMIVFALGQYKTKAQSPTQPTVQATVLVATAQINQGTEGAAIAARALYKSTPVVASQVSPGAISDASMLAGKVASVNILPGQQLTVADFTGITGISGLLTPDQRAIALSISESPGATDVLQPGDHVDIYASGFPSSTLATLVAPNIEIVKQAGASVTAQNGQVSATPAAGASTTASATTSTSSASSTTSSSTAPGASSGSVTSSGGSMVLAVTAAQASDLEWLAARSQYTLYLTLRPPNATNKSRVVTSAANVMRDAIALSNTTPNGVK